MNAGGPAVGTRQAAVNILVLMIKHASMSPSTHGEGMTPRKTIEMGLNALTALGVDASELGWATMLMVRDGSGNVDKL